MSLSPVNLLDIAGSLPDPPILEPEENAENQDNNDPNWLTIRRRCELCKQRKVRLSTVLAILA